MKVSILIIMGIIASCGRYEAPQSGNLNTYNSVVPEAIPVGSAEHTRIKDMCDSIQRKSETLPALVNTSYVFSGTTKDCSDPEFKSLEDSTVSIINDNGRYKFGQASGLFYFDDVETINDGLFGALCSRLSALTTPLALDPTNLIYFTTVGIAGSDCETVSNERCIKIERATKETSEGELRGRVHTREWIRIRMDEPRRGFFTYKKRVSQGSCENGFYIGRTATLK